MKKDSRKMTDGNGMRRAAISFLTLLVAALILAAPAGAQEKEKGAQQSSAADVWRQALPPESETAGPEEGADVAPAGPGDSLEETEAGLVELERRWMEALRLRDASALSQIIPDDFTLLDPRLSIAAGEREKYFNHAMRDLNLASYDFEALTVRLYGTAAVVTGRLKQTATVAGQDWGGTYLVTDVWVNRDGLWQVVSRHTTPLPNRP